MSAPTRIANGSCHGGLCRSQDPEGPGPVRSGKEVYVGNFYPVEIALIRVSTLDIAGFVPRLGEPRLPFNSVTYSDRIGGICKQDG